MEALSNPFYLVIVIVLSAVSTYILWRGMKERHLASIFIGAGIGIPTFDLTDYRFWIGGAAIVLFGFWIKGKMESM